MGYNNYILSFNFIRNMFNDLNQANNQAGSNAPVDDIFAETEPGVTQGQSTQPVAGIETRRVGLAAGDGALEAAEEPSSPWFKILVISIVAIIAILGAYLAYIKFMAPQDVNVVGVSEVQVPVTPTVEDEVFVDILDEVMPVVGEEAVLSEELPVEELSPAEDEVVPIIPGVNSPAEEFSILPVEEEVVAPVVPLDSDLDGLTDLEENESGTNINIVDTDGDGLSDYEEIKIYGTNPLLADTDGDGYSDGDEISNGYNPLGAGKLGENQ